MFSDARMLVMVRVDCARVQQKTLSSFLNCDQLCVKLFKTNKNHSKLTKNILFHLLAIKTRNLIGCLQ